MSKNNAENQHGKGRKNLSGVFRKVSQASTQRRCLICKKRILNKPEVFIKEPKLYGFYNAPNSGEIFGVAVADGKLFYVMKWIPNSTMLSLVPSEIVKKTYPQKIIKFFQDNLFMMTNDNIPAAG